MKVLSSLKTFQVWSAKYAQERSSILIDLKIKIFQLYIQLDAFNNTAGIKKLYCKVCGANHTLDRLIQTTRRKNRFTILSSEHLDRNKLIVTLKSSTFDFNENDKLGSIRYQRYLKKHTSVRNGDRV